jgi:hypothetical protein
MKFKKSYDVVIAGGGISGVAAALSAAESGLKTVLIEKTAWWGGLATGGMIYIYLPLDDGMGHQVSFGMAEKLYRASIKYGPGSIDPAWQQPNPDQNPAHKRFRTPFVPAAFILAMDELLENSGVELFLDTVIINVQHENRTVNTLEVFNKGGHGLIQGKVFIDATGDCEIARMSGCDFVEEANYLSFWGMQINEKTERAGDLSEHLAGACRGIIKPKADRLALNAHGCTDFLLDSRRWLREHFQDKNIDRQLNYPVSLPTLPQFRRTAHIVNKNIIKEDTHNMPFADSIGMAADWCNVNIVQEIPFSAMLTPGNDNLIVAGRAIAAENYAWDLVRSIPAVAVSGQAAGCAAALCVKNNQTVHTLDIKSLQQQIRKQGGCCTMAELALPYRHEKNYQEPVWLHGQH